MSSRESKWERVLREPLQEHDRLSFYEVYRDPVASLSSRDKAQVQRWVEASEQAPRYLPDSLSSRDLSYISKLNRRADKIPDNFSPPVSILSKIAMWWDLNVVPFVRGWPTFTVK